MRRFRALIKKEMTHMLRDPRTLVFIFLMPIMQLVLLGYINNTEIRHVPTVVFNQDNEKASRDLLNSFETTDYFSFDYAVYSQEEVYQMIDGSKAKVGIIIPPDFSHNIATRKQADVLVLLDGSDPTIAGAVLSAAALAGQAHGVNVRTQQLSGQGMSGSTTSPVDVRTSVLYNPDLLASYNLVPGLIAIILFQTATSLTALAIVKERERGTIEQLIVTPIRSWELVIAKIIPFIIVAFGNTILIMALATFLFHVPLRGSFILLFSMVGLFLLPTLGLGLLISTAARTQQQAQLMTMPIMLPAMMLAGVFFPISSLPMFLQVVGKMLPLTYFVFILRSVLVKGVGLEMILPQVAALTVFAIVLLGWAAARFKKTLD
jgi:ABC-2 type transport system permease protein